MTVVFGYIAQHLKVCLQFILKHCTINKDRLRYYEGEQNIVNINIENIPSCPIAYIRSVGAYGVGNAQTMEQLKKWATSNHLINSKTVIFGIAHDDPQITPPKNCRYDVCIILDDNSFSENDSVRHGELCGGKYAVFTVEHTAEAIEQAWAEISLSLEMGYYPDSARPILERYAAEKIAQHLCEICVPIA